METKVFMKTKGNFLWEKYPALPFMIFIFGATFLFFAIMIVGTDYIVKYNLPDLVYIPLVIIVIAVILGIGVLLPVKLNNEKNISKSIAFIKKEDKWYAVKLMYGMNETGVAVNMPHGSVGQLASLPHNIEVASNVQKKEREIKEARTKKEVYMKVLDEILSTLTCGSYETPIVAKLDKKIDIFLNGYAFEEMITQNNTLCGYLILDDLKLERETKKHFTVSFNQNGKRLIMKFGNVYGGLLEEFHKEVS